MKDAEVSIKGYTMIRADRPVRTQGGVAICYQENLSSLESMTFSNKTCEVCITQIVQLKATIVAIYRPPDTRGDLFQEALNKIDTYLTDLNKQKNDIFIMGDLNLPNVDWDSGSTRPGCSKNDRDCLTRLGKLMEDHFLIQSVDVPTRKENILDVILTNGNDIVRKISTEDTIMSDHKIVMCYLGYREWVNKVEEVVARTGFNALNLHKADWENINEDLSRVTWQELTTGPVTKDSVAITKSTGFEVFSEKVLEICQNHAPPRSSRQRKNKNKQRALLRKKKRIKDKIKALEEQNNDSSKTADLKGTIIDIELEIRDRIKGQLNEDEATVIEQIKTNPKAFYSYANSFQKTKQNIGPLEDTESHALTNDPKEMADILQKQYVKVFSDPNAEIPEEVLGKRIPKICIEDFVFTEEDIEKAIDELQTHAASGPDNFPAIVLKKCKQNLSRPLYHLWRKSLDTGRIPEHLLSQRIVPIFKKGSKTDAQNYRPVSLTSHLIKVFERVMRNALVKYLEDNHLLSKHQHGFRKSKSCVTQLLAHIDTILEMLSEGANADVIYLDFAKAFDKVSHKILLKKIENLGINGKVLTWLKSFLSNRYQSVTVEGELSFLHLVLSGVPQGTVLGPLLFIIFIDDLYEVVKHSIARSLADDTRLTKAVKSHEDQLNLQADLEAVIKWSADNNMELHEGKFELLQHGKDTQFKGTEGHSYHLSNGHALANSKTVKDLGITIDESLGWSTHINNVSKQASQTSAWVLRTFTTRQPFPLMTLYKSLIRSRLDYCCPVWAPIKKEDICSLESIQRSFTARINCLKGRTYWERLKELKLMSVQRRRERYIILHMWKIFTHIAPNDIGVVINWNDRTGPVCRVPQLRSKSMYANTLRYHSFASIGPRLFNALPRFIKESSSLESFKVVLDDLSMTLPDTFPTPGYIEANNNTLLDSIVTIMIGPSGL